MLTFDLNEALEAYEPPPPKPVDFIMTAESFCRQDYPRRTPYLTPIVKERDIILIPGWRGTGKTWFALSILDAITRESGFGPWKAGTAVPGMYIDAELSPDDMQERLLAINPNHDRKAPLFVYNDCAMTAQGVRRASFLDDIWRHDTKQMLLDLGIKVVCFDNISSLSPGLDENSKQAWDVVNQWLIELRFAGIASMLPHHTSKAGVQRGTSGREDNVDMSIMLKHPPDYSPENGCDFIVSFSKARVPQEHLHALADVRMRMTTKPDGSIEWTWGFVKTENRKTILEMLRSGCSYDEIVAATGVSKAYISKVKKEVKFG